MKLLLWTVGAQNSVNSIHTGRRLKMPTLLDSTRRDSLYIQESRRIGGANLVLNNTFHGNGCTMDQELKRELLGGAGRTLRVHSPDSSTFLCKIMSWPPFWMCDVIWLCQSMRIYLKNNPAKFHPASIWDDGTLGFFGRGFPKKNYSIKMSTE